MLFRKTCGIGKSCLKMAKQNVDKCFFVSELDEEGEIRVRGLPWLSPTLKRYSAYEAKSPALRFADGLQFSGSLEDFIHGRLPS